MRMDLDVGVEPELDTFSLILPLPYRVAIILVTGIDQVLDLNCRWEYGTDERNTGIWAWGLNLHYLNIIQIVCHILTAVRHPVNMPRTFHL